MLIQWRTAGLVLLGMSLPIVSIAETSNQTLKDESHPFGKLTQFQFQWENDSRLPFNKSNETDRWYTQGIKFTGIFDRPTDETNLAYMTANWWCGKKNEQDQKDCLTLMSHSFTLGQNMYTPAKITVAVPQPNDRPWAGWLYVNRAVLLPVPETQEKSETQEKFDLTVGVTGPLSHAEQIQKWWHRGDLGIVQLGSAPTPMGWDNQLKNEIGVNVSYENRIRRSHHIASTKSLDWDATTICGWYAGTVLTALKAGGEVRVGENLQHYGSVDGWMPSPQVYIEAQGDAAKKPVQPQQLRKEPTSGEESFYLLAGFEFRAVARNLFLDGNTFESSPSVHKKPFVYDLWAGFSWKATKTSRISYRQVRRSPDFDTPAGQAAFQNFSVFTVTHSF